jgi:hypothetical protein
MKENSMLRSARHPVNIGQLVMGVAFLGLVVVWALIQSDVVGGDDVRWLLPVPWVLAGLAGLLATTRSGRDWERAENEATAPQPSAPDDTLRYDADADDVDVR